MSATHLPFPEPIPPSYTLDGMLEALRISKPNMYRAGLHHQIRRYPVGGRDFIYNAEDVRNWAKRLARRSILVAWGLLGAKSPLSSAPEREDLDEVCPRCREFALGHPEIRGLMRCVNGHEIQVSQNGRRPRVRQTPRKT